MRAGVIVTGVMGLGTALVFAVAALTSTLFPNGTVVGGGMNGMMVERGFGGGGIAMPVPAPAVPVPAPAIDIAPDVNVRVDPGIMAPNDFKALPGDIVVTDDANGVELAPAP